MIPTSILSRLDNYEVEIEGTIIKTTLVDHKALLETYISELRSLCETPMPIIGVDLKQGEFTTYAQLLILCIENRCLIVHLHHLNEAPDCLKQFLADEELCFVGVGVSYNCIEGFDSWRGVELRHLVARGLKKPSLEECGFRELVREVGISLKEPSKSDPCLVASPGFNIVTSSNWSRRVFSTEELKYVIYYAYGSYLVGKKLLSML